MLCREDFIHEAHGQGPLKPRYVPRPSSSSVGLLIRAAAAPSLVIIVKQSKHRSLVKLNLVLQSVCFFTDAFAASRHWVSRILFILSLKKPLLKGTSTRNGTRYTFRRQVSQKLLASSHSRRDFRFSIFLFSSLSVHLYPTTCRSQNFT